MTTFFGLINLLILSALLSRFVGLFISDFELSIKFNKRNLMSIVNLIIFYYLSYNAELHNAHMAQLAQAKYNLTEPIVSSGLNFTDSNQ